VPGPDQPVELQYLLLYPAQLSSECQETNAGRFRKPPVAWIGDDIEQFLDTVTPIRPILLRSPTVYRQTVWLPLLDWSRLVKSRAGATARTSLPRICRTFPVCGRRSIFRCWLRSPGRCRRAGHGCTAWWKPPSVPTMPHLTVSGALGFVSQRSRCRE
jgi:hypothetical protein